MTANSAMHIEQIEINGCILPLPNTEELEYDAQREKIRFATKAGQQVSIEKVQLDQNEKQACIKHPGISTMEKLLSLYDKEEPKRYLRKFSQRIPQENEQRTAAFVALTIVFGNLFPQSKYVAAAQGLCFALLAKLIVNKAAAAAFAVVHNKKIGSQHNSKQLFRGVVSDLTLGIAKQVGGAKNLLTSLTHTFADDFDAFIEQTWAAAITQGNQKLDMRQSKPK